MKCSEVLNEISAYLDGELSAAQSESVKAHLSECDACREEYESLAHVSELMRKMPAGFRAPEGFKDAVMARIAAEPQPAPVKAAPTRFRRWAVGVAAGVLLVVGSFAIQSEPVQQLAHKGGPLIKSPVQQEEAGISPGKADPGEVAIQPNGTQLPGKSETGAKPGENASQSPGIATQVKPKAPSAYTGNPVLLNHNQQVSNTVLKVRVSDVSNAVQQAQAFGNESGARYDDLGQQVKGDQRYTVGKFTVAHDKNAALLKKFQWLGTVISKDTDSKDISAQYNDLLSQYQSITVQRDAADDPDKKAQLDQQAKNLERQLKNLESQSEFDTIVLWIEG